MLLRKHIGSARIVSVKQPGLERILEFELEHLDELGDLCKKRLIVEIMGKHSNIIFCKEDGTIIDSIKHVSASMSSVREVLPGREYFIPQTIAKENPLTITGTVFRSCILSSPTSVQKALYGHLTGISLLLRRNFAIWFHRLRPKRRRTDGPGTDSSVSYFPADDGGCQRRTFQPCRCI